MNYSPLDPETSKLFRAIHRYKRACQKYIDGRPLPGLALIRVQSAFDTLIEALNNKIIRHRLDIVIKAGLASGSPIHEVSPDDMNLEAAMSSLFGLKAQEVIAAIHSNIEDEIYLVQISSSNDLIKLVEEFHNALIQKTALARSIDIRIKKKRTKRNIGQALTSILFGSGCAVLNSFTLGSAPAMAASYGASLTAFHAAFRDIVGEKPED